MPSNINNYYAYFVEKSFIPPLKLNVSNGKNTARIVVHEMECFQTISGLIARNQSASAE